jgi:hypothetical protein
MHRGLLLLKLAAALAALVAAAPLLCAQPARDLESGFLNPPPSARLRAYWWWLNGNVTKAAITRDLEEMKAKGFGGAVILDAGGAEQDGNDRVPHGPTFFSPEWRELYKHALREADRLGLEMSLNILSGWNLGGPMVPAEDAVKKLVFSEAEVQGPGRVAVKLPQPQSVDGFYRDVLVVAWRGNPALPPDRPPLKNLGVKALFAKPRFAGPDAWFLANSAPDTAPFLLDEEPSRPGEEDTHAADVLNLSDRLAPDGTLNWDAPEGTWHVARFGCTLADSRRVSTPSDGSNGYALDVLDRDAFRRYWDAVVEPLVADAGPLAGKTLKYLHTDSWEVDVFNWTPTVCDEFKKRRGYDPLPWFPVFAGRIVESREASNRFLYDFRRTLGDLAVDNHYRPFHGWAARHGLGIHPEAGGPHFTPIDAQQCFGATDVPMSEFWAASATHRRTEEVRFFVKQPASAAHTYGRRIVAAEGFTTVGPHWQETLWDNLKPSFDQAACEGLNRLVWHAFVCSPAEMGVPGQQYFAGTHFNPNTTWWAKSAPFLNYLNRCQFLLQQGLFVGDACYYYGDMVPNFAQLKRSDPAKVLPGYDYDVATKEVVLTRMSVRDGRIVLPDGMSYRVLVLPDHPMISPEVLRKLKELVAAGATVIGPKPSRATGLTNYPRCDDEVRKLADELWDNCDGKSITEHTFGKGRVIWGTTAREVFAGDSVKPDFQFSGGQKNSFLDYIHRRDGETEIYFVANRSNRWEEIDCTFRVSGKTPELWDPVTGETRLAAAFTQSEGRTTLPLEFAPYGSLFVIFRKPAANQAGTATRNFPTFSEPFEITGPWTVNFDPKWGGPASVEFATLVSWPHRPEDGIKYYSGTAIYHKTFDLPVESRFTNRASRIFLDLGDVKNIAEVKLNGKNLGILWAVPFRVDVTDVIRPTGNELEIEVVNFWPNRIIGDQFLPPEKRFTKTNIRKLTKNTPLPESGLLGPVRIVAAPLVTATVVSIARCSGGSLPRHRMSG